MKKLLVVLAVSLMCFTAKAQQFTNPSFETWAANMPQGWSTLGFMGFNLCTMEQSTDANTGNYSVKIAPKMLDATIAAMMQMEPIAFPGFLTNGNLNIEVLMQFMQNAGSEITEEDYMYMLTNLITGGLQIEENNQPTSVSGYYKFNWYNYDYDYFEIMAVLFGTVEGQRTVVGMGLADGYPGAKTEGFQSFEMPIHYLSEQPANEIVLITIVAGDEFQTTDFPELYLDDIMINYSSSLEDVETEVATTIFPNPTNGKIRINCENNSYIQIVNPLGQVVKEINNYTPNSIIEIEQSGIYFVKINGEKTTKVIVK
ncbi:MAG: T9SS type A sorting domain-containing protein [Bacteroidales bacterium]|nr:T9SS type A sorting domain-containing protein [Bacteroidales bacterium]